MILTLSIFEPIEEDLTLRLHVKHLQKCSLLSQTIEL